MFADLILEAKENCQYVSLLVECKIAPFSSCSGEHPLIPLLKKKNDTNKRLN